MSNMDTTYDTARRCPICEELGAEISKKPFRNGSKQITFQCRNERCRWYNTNYTISVRPDGTIPEPTLLRDKHYPKLSVDKTEEVQTAIDAQIAAERKGSELTRRYR